MTTLIVPLGPPEPPTPPLMTAEEFVKRYPKHWVELVDGVVKGVAVPGFEHGVIVGAMARLLGNHVVDHSLGRVVTCDTYFVTKREPYTVRGMDVAYISYGRLPRGPVPRGALEVAPELVAEVRSPTDAWTDVFAKVEEYLRAGVGVVVVLDAERRTASVCRPGPVQADFHAGDTLAVPDVLPGFAVEVARLFE